MTRRTWMVFVALGSWLPAGRVSAAPVTDSTMAPPGAIVVHFDEVAIAAGSDVGNEFAAYGVTFPSPPAWAWNDWDSIYPVIFGASLDNFSGSSYCATTYSIQFAAPVGFAGFNIVTNAGDNTDLIATLGGAFVESNVFTTESVMGGFIGFDNPGGFDRLDVEVQHNSNGCMIIDELTLEGSNCGDGIIDGAEACDDAGESATCDANCTLASCGDNTTNMTAGEECDGGGATPTCNADCTAALCGDGIIDDAEACDDAGESAACDANCSLAVCGDNITNMTAGEQCDEGGATPTCNADCTAPFCGDGEVNMPAGEDCDDGGESATCDADCTPAACGDNFTNMTAGEDCDDSTESPTCDPDCTTPVCGDGYENNTALEVCDDGNTADCDGCRADCSAEEGCGDGFLCPPEECDDSNVVDGDGCSAACLDETAGTSSGEGGTTGDSSGEAGTSESGPSVDESGTTSGEAGSGSASEASATSASSATASESSGDGGGATSTGGAQTGNDSGCGCTSDRSPVTAWAWWLALAAVRRRPRAAS